MSRRERAKKSRRRAKLWIFKEYVDLPRSIRNKTDPIVRKINKSKPRQRTSAQKGKEEVVKRLKKLVKKL